MMRRVWSLFPSARHNLVTQGRYFCSQLQQHQTESAATDETISTWDLEVKQQFRILYERAQKVSLKIYLNINTKYNINIYICLFLHFRNAIS